DTPARAQRLTAALRRIVDARWPGASGERRSHADRQIDVRADATLRAADLLPLLRATVRDTDGRVLFPEHVLRAPPPPRSPEPAPPTRTLEPGMVVIGSEPSAAEVFVDGKLMGSTPLVFTVAGRSPPLTVRLERAGYEPCMLELDTTKGAQASCRLRPRAP
ncbi:MAG: PEGA domain-containing protein, partial [Polyangiaceae bacterium]|nr:PEGA domain-containing protein [Polyangiaceae bacterium]